MEVCGEARLSPDFNPVVLMSRELKQADYECPKTDKKSGRSQQMLYISVQVSVGD